MQIHEAELPDAWEFLGRRIAQVTQECAVLHGQVCRLERDIGALHKAQADLAKANKELTAETARVRELAQQVVDEAELKGLESLEPSLEHVAYD